MNGMMGYMGFFKGMINPVASKAGQPSCSTPSPKNEGDSSFLECLLGASNGAGHVVVSQASIHNGRILLGSSLLKGIGWPSAEGQMESPLLEGDGTNDLGKVFQKAGIEVTLGVAHVKGTNGEATGVSSDIGKASGMMEGKEARLVEDRSSVSSTVDSEGLEGKSGNTLRKESAIHRLFTTGTAKGVDPALAEEKGGETGTSLRVEKISGEKVSALTSETVTPENSEGRMARSEIGAVFSENIWRGSGKGTMNPETNQQTPRDGHTDSWASGRPTEARPLFAKGAENVPVDGKGVDGGEGLSPIAQKPAQRFHSALVSRQMGGDMATELVSDRSAHDIGQQRGMARLMPHSEEVTHSQMAQAAAFGETESVLSRPSPISLTDSIMQQVLEHLNIRTWKVGQNDLKIQLHPQEMGRVHMEIGMKDHQVVLKIHVENPQVKELIENSLAQLRDSLFDQGLRMDRCSVTVGEHFQDQSGGSDEGLAGTYDQSLPSDKEETEEGRPKGLASSYSGESDLVNLFI